MANDYVPCLICHDTLGACCDDVCTDCCPWCNGLGPEAEAEAEAALAAADLAHEPHTVEHLFDTREELAGWK
jgi:hypothetical protein